MATSEAPARSVAPDPLPANLDRWYPNREGVRWSGMPCSPRRRLPTETTIAVVLLALATSGCDDYLKEWREKREAKRQEEADRAKPDYIPPHCRHPYGLYRVFSAVTHNHPACAGRESFYNDRVVWWGGTDRYGPGHKATRVRKEGCTFEYSENGFVGTESRGWATAESRPADEGKLLITYEGTWTRPAPPGWQGSCVATGWEQFAKE